MSTERTPRTTYLAADRPRPPGTPREDQRPQPTRGIEAASFRSQYPPPFAGAELWAEIHRRALAHDGSDDSAFIATVTARLPCSTCRPHWLEMLERTPPDFGETYFAWTVKRHNEVNLRLGKPVLTIAEAEAIWRA